MKIKFVLISFILIFISCKITKQNQYSNDERKGMSKREIREKLDFYYWVKNQHDILESDVDTLYGFSFNRYNKRKGTFYKLSFNNTKPKIYSERQFKILDYLNNGLILRFQDMDKTQISKLYFKSWVEMFLDSVAYHPVMYE